MIFFEFLEDLFYDLIEFISVIGVIAMLSLPITLSFILALID